MRSLLLLIAACAIQVSCDAGSMTPESAEAVAQYTDAITRNDVNQLTKVLGNGFDPNFQVGGNGPSGLHAAAGFGHVECLKRLVDSGADVNIVDSSNGRTPLHQAVYYSDEQFTTVKMLIESGADSSVRDSQGMTPLDYAIANGHDKCAAFLKDLRTHNASR